MSEAAVARAYAQALLDAAREAGAVERVGRELGEFVAALQASAPLRHALHDPHVDSEAKLRVVGELTREAQPLLANTLQLMLQKGRAAAIPALGDQYARLAAREAEIVTVEVTTAVALAAPSRERLLESVRVATGRRVELAERVDPAVIGGLVLRVGDTIADGSVRNRINQLRRRLQTAEV
jgi:ATP synthase F1 delta subunit